MSASTKIDKLLKAIADPTRRKIFHVLVVASPALSITQIAGDFSMSRQGVTKHIKTLEEAGLIKISNKGRERYCQANASALKEVSDWLQFYEQFWDSKIKDLENFLDGKA